MGRPLQAGAQGEWIEFTASVHTIARQGVGLKKVRTAMPRSERAARLRAQGGPRKSMGRPPQAGAQGEWIEFTASVHTIARQGVGLKKVRTAMPRSERAARLRAQGGPRKSMGRPPQEGAEGEWVEVDRDHWCDSATGVVYSRAARLALAKPIIEQRKLDARRRRRAASAPTAAEAAREAARVESHHRSTGTPRRATPTTCGRTAATP